MSVSEFVTEGKKNIEDLKLLKPEKKNGSLNSANIIEPETDKFWLRLLCLKVGFGPGHAKMDRTQKYSSTDFRCVHTNICPRSSYPFYVVRYYIE